MRKIKLEEMTLEDKLSFVLCMRRFKNEDDINYILDLVRRRAVGSIQIPPNRPDIVARVREAADYPIIIVCDMEQGFPTSERPKVQSLALSATGDMKYIRAFTKGIVNDAMAAGYNCVWSPVVDVLRGDCPAMVYRCFSDDAKTVALCAEEMCRVFSEHHFLMSCKHYPGGQDIPVDTHIADKGSNVDEKTLREVDLVPYEHLIKLGLLDTIMVGHHLFPKLDPEYPASLSKKVLDYIRDLGFDGICFTDSFAMMSILNKFGEDKIYGMAMAAGNDVILPNYRTDPKECYEYLVENFKAGAFTEERLDEAVRRILRAQDYVSEMEDGSCVFTEEDEETLRDVAKRAICSVTDEGITPAIGEDTEDRVFVLMHHSGYSPDSDVQEIRTGEWYDHKRVEQRIKEIFPKATVMLMSEYPNPHDNQSLLSSVSKFSEVVLVTFCTTTAYLGSDCLTRRAEAILNGIIYSGNVSAVVHFGNPYAIETLEHTPRRIFGFMTPDSQKHTIDVLAGNIIPNGKMPIKLNLQ